MRARGSGWACGGEGVMERPHWSRTLEDLCSNLAIRLNDFNDLF